MVGVPVERVRPVKQHFCGNAGPQLCSTLHMKIFLKDDLQGNFEEKIKKPWQWIVSFMLSLYRQVESEDQILIVLLLLDWSSTFYWVPLIPETE